MPGSQEAPPSLAPLDRVAQRRAWESVLTDRLGRTVRVRFNRARCEPVRWSWSPAAPDHIELVLHERFASAEDEIRNAMASWIRVGKRARRASATLDGFIAEHIETLPRRKRRITLSTAGQVHDLGHLNDELLATRFHEDFHAGGEPRVTWGRRVKSRSRGSLRLGSFDAEDQVVRIHPVLDQAIVPEWFVRYVLFHELLHAALPPRPGTGNRWVHHGPDFRRREQAYPDYARALEWEAENLARLVRAARRGPSHRPRPRLRPVTLQSLPRLLQGVLFGGS